MSSDPYPGEVLSSVSNHPSPPPPFKAPSKHKRDGGDGGRRRAQARWSLIPSMDNASEGFHVWARSVLDESKPCDGTSVVSVLGYGLPGNGFSIAEDICGSR